MIIFIESIKSELDKLTWTQIITWSSYVVVPFLGWLFSKIVQTMPEPTLGDSKFYIWLYRLLQVVGANDKHAQDAKEVLQQKSFIKEMDKKSDDITKEKETKPDESQKNN